MNYNWEEHLERFCKKHSNMFLMQEIAEEYAVDYFVSMLDDVLTDEKPNARHVELCRNRLERFLKEMFSEDPYGNLEFHLDQFDTKVRAKGYGQ